MKIFVGNLSSETTKDDLCQAFEGFGQVASVTVIKGTGKCKTPGFGFIIMPLANAAQNAIKKLHGQDFKGRTISVEKSRTNARPVLADASEVASKAEALQRQAEEVVRANGEANATTNDRQWGRGRKLPHHLARPTTGRLLLLCKRPRQRTPTE